MIINLIMQTVALAKTEKEFSDLQNIIYQKINTPLDTNSTLKN